MRAVVVDPESPANIEDAHVRTELTQADEHAARLAKRVGVRADRGDLRADVEVQQRQRVQHVGGAQLLDECDDLGLLPGYSDALIYEIGALDTSMPLEALRRKSRIDPAVTAIDDPEFSRKIRGL